jgi:hypothetical protein
MKPFELTRTKRVQSARERELVLAVLTSTYVAEKGWIDDAETLFPVQDLERTDVSWFLSAKRGQPIGVLRVNYDPPIAQYAAYGLKPVDESIDIAALLAHEKIAEVGRFAVVPGRRNSIAVVVSLMHAATREIVTRGCTQLVTDVFENDPHSPLGFHTRIAGFKPVATHDIGELRHMGRRITLLLNLRLAYRSLRARGNRFFRVMTRGWTVGMHERLAA